MAQLSGSPALRAPSRTLKKDDAYRFLRLITVLVWSVAVIGIAAWFGATESDRKCYRDHWSPSSVVQGTKGDVRIEYNSAPPLK